MAITQQQLENTLNLKGVFSLINGAATLTDSSVWSSLGVTSAKILLQINDPTGDLVYQNAGYFTANYGAPDLDVFASVPTFSFTLPQDINGAYLQGTYTINIAIQIISAFGTQTFSDTVYENVSSCCNGVVANVTPVINYLNAQVTVVDNTNYGNFISVANTITLYPDPTAGQAAQTATGSGTPYTLIWQPPMGQKTYTGNWKWTLSSVLTYIDQTTQAQTTCLVTGSGVFEVNQNPICKVLCFINKYVAQVQLQQANSTINAALMERQLIQAQGYFALLLGMNDCGKNGEAYVNMIYRLIGVLNPNDGDCCGCGGTNVTPLIPSQSINGSDGTDGLSFLQGVGAPGSGLGVVGDSYLNSTNDDLYKKTGSSTWTLTGNLQGAQGVSGAIVLHNDISNSATLGTALEILKTYTLPLNTLSTDGSFLKIRAEFTTSTANASPSTKLVGLYFNGNSIADAFEPYIIFNGQGRKIILEATVNRFSNTVLKNEQYFDLLYGFLVGSQSSIQPVINQGIFSMAGLNLTTTVYDITAKANGEVIGDITCTLFTVTYYKK